MARTHTPKTRRPSTRGSATPPSDSAQRGVGLVIEWPTVKVVESGHDISPETALVTQWMLDALDGAGEALGQARVYIAAAGILGSDAQEERVRAALRTAVQGLGIGSESAQRWSEGGCELELRAFHESANAMEWVETHLLNTVNHSQTALTVENTDKDKAIESAVEAAICLLPPDYLRSAAILQGVHEHIRVKIAAALEPLLNLEAARHPQSTYDEKKELCKWINAELRRFGLALAVPDRSEPCFLLANPGGRPGFGRFMLYYFDGNGRRRDALTAVSLPHLSLRLDDLAHAHGQRVGRSGLVPPGPQ